MGRIEAEEIAFIRGACRKARGANAQAVLEHSCDWQAVIRGIDAAAIAGRSGESWIGSLDYDHAVLARPCSPKCDIRGRADAEIDSHKGWDPQSKLANDHAMFAMPRVSTQLKSSTRRVA